MSISDICGSTHPSLAGGRSVAGRQKPTGGDGMRGLRRVSAAIAATIFVTAGVIGAASAASASTGVGSCSAQGNYATCAAGGTATKPVTLTVSVTSSPDQDVYVAWDAVCSQGTGSGSTSGSFTAETPVSRTVSHSY